MKPTMTQQEFLREAMASLNMTRAAFCVRLGCAPRTLDKWLLPATSNDFRNMDETIWMLVREVIAHDRLRAKHEELKASLSQKNQK